ncbi:hypothetical protein [Streptomyces spirodelae]|uniref:DUF1304 domain-containing protein n=1 Tax=Streptomyces spirodelae TaxID=2812904 RepID=A0ABS3WLX4_9ACTN|nr:hypothetical protein [Streptomyces spirodelae]MBO8184118.1 hypothetical protein [Streptomyces spirodelae]
MAEVLAYVAAGLVLLWGVSHAIPTRGVVAGYGELTADNRRILVQEWLAEAVTMFSLATLVIVVTAVGAGTSATEWAYRVVAGALVVLAVLTALTGARTRIVWFKICPVLLSASAALLLVASVI